VNKFQKALDDYAHHLRWVVGYSPNEATLMLIGFAAGWKEKEKVDEASKNR